MQVETYKEERKEIADEELLRWDIAECTKELEYVKDRKRIALDHGLQGQVRLLQKEEERFAGKLVYLKNQKVVRYPQLTSLQWTILKSHFNRSEPIEKFEVEVIPPQVLEEYHEAKQLGVFKEISVAFHGPLQDPLVLGWLPNEPLPYLIARWGDALQPWKWFVKRWYGAWNGGGKDLGETLMAGVLVGMFLLLAGFVPLHAFAGKLDGMTSPLFLVAVAMGASMGCMAWFRYFRPLRKYYTPSPFK